MALSYWVSDAQGETSVEIEQTGDGWRFAVGGEKHEADVSRVNAECVSVLLGGESYKVYCLETGAKTVICLRGELYELEVLDEREKVMRDSRHGSPAAAGSPGQVRSRIPGKIVAVLVSEGQAVKAGDKLLVVEAMKMENEIRAAAGGVVTRVLTSPGETVETGTLMMELECDSGGPAAGANDGA